MDYDKIEILPQLCQSSEIAILNDTTKLSDYILELKFDGTRILPHIGDNSIKLYTRNGISELSQQYPDIINAITSLQLPSETILDGELVFYTSDNNIEFQSALITHDTMLSRRLIPKIVVFDILKYNNEDCINLSWTCRRVLLESLVKENSNIKLSQVFYNPYKYNEIFQNEVDSGREGIVLKQKTACYLPNKRNSTWIKCKRRDNIDCVVMGITEGTGKYQDTFGSLILGNVIDDKLKIIGYCSGMDDSTRAQLYDQIMNMETVYYNNKSSKKVIKYIKPIIIVEVAYMEQTEYGMLRHPAFVQIRYDKNIDVPKSAYIEKNKNNENNGKTELKLSDLSEFL